MKKIIPSVVLITVSTLCFYVPSTLFDLTGFDVSTVPDRFYQYYAWMFAGALTLNIVYAWFLFWQIRFDNLALKIPVCWLVIAETYMLIYHIFNKIYLQKIPNSYGRVVTIVFFSISCMLLIYSAIKSQAEEAPKKQPCIKSAPFLRNSIVTSSLAITVIGVYSLIFKSGPLLESTAFTIPIFSFYILYSNINTGFAKAIIYLHGIFWIILFLSTLRSVPLVMVALFLYIFHRGKYNFIELADGCHA